MNTTKLFLREGTPFNFTMFRASHDGAHPYYMSPRKCTRCGGLGGSDAWKHTGWKCYDCDGSGVHKNGPQKVRLYTEEELAKLNAAQDKRNATKEKKLSEKRSAEKAAADTRMMEFLVQHGELLARAEKFTERSDFIRDVRAKAIEKCMLTEKQASALANAVERFEAGDKAKATSQWVGKVDERIRGLKVTVINRVFVASFGAYDGGSIAITTLRTEFGETIVTKTNAFCPPKGSIYVIDGSVVEHSEYRGEKQTRLKRITVKERLYIPEEDRDAA